MYCYCNSLEMFTLKFSSISSFPSFSFKLAALDAELFWSLFLDELAGSKTYEEVNFQNTLFKKIQNTKYKI